MRPAGQGDPQALRVRGVMSATTDSSTPARRPQRLTSGAVAARGADTSGLPKLHFAKQDMPALRRLKDWQRREMANHGGAAKFDKAAAVPERHPMRAEQSETQETAQIHTGVNIATGIALAALTILGLIWLAPGSMEMVIDSLYAFVE